MAGETHFVVKSALDLEVGNEVVIGVSESDILRGAFLVYILPLLGMFLFAMLIDVVLAPASEAIKLVAGAAGFLLILGWVRARHKRATGDAFSACHRAAQIPNSHDHIGKTSITFPH